MALNNKRKAPDKEKRLILLYIIARIGCISDMQLLQLLFENDLMNYFDMMITLSDLCAQGQCTRTPSNGNSMYTPTDAGKEAVELFANDIPASIRMTLDENMPSWKEQVLTQQTYPTAHRQTHRGEYCLDLSVMEKDMEMLRISLSLPTEELAKQLEAAWPAKAGQIYSMLFTVLAEPHETKTGAE